MIDEKELPKIKKDEPRLTSENIELTKLKAELNELKNIKIEITPKEFEKSKFYLLSFECPLSYELMTDPVIAEDGITYQRDTIEKYFSDKKSKNIPITSPLNRGVMKEDLIKNNNLIGIIDEQKILFEKEKAKSLKLIPILDKEIAALEKQITLLQEKQPEVKTEIKTEAKQAAISATSSKSNTMILCGHCNVSMINKDNFTLALVEYKKIQLYTPADYEENKKHIEKDVPITSLFFRIEVDKNNVVFNYNHDSKKEIYYLKKETHNAKIIELKSLYTDVIDAHSQIIMAKLEKIPFYKKTLSSINDEKIMETKFAKLLDLMEAPQSSPNFFFAASQAEIDLLKLDYKKEYFQIFQKWHHRNDENRNSNNKMVNAKSSEHITLYGSFYLRLMPENFTLSAETMRKIKFYTSEDLLKKNHPELSEISSGEAIIFQIKVPTNECYHIGAVYHLIGNNFYNLMELKPANTESITQLCNSIDSKLKNIKFYQESLAKISKETKIEIKLGQLLDLIELYPSKGTPDYAKAETAIASIKKYDQPQKYQLYQKWYHHCNNENMNLESEQSYLKKGFNP